MIYLYMCSVILGGFLYFLNIEFKTDKFSVNYLVLLIVAPGILYLYYKEHKRFASTYNYNLNVSICFCNGKTYSCSGFVDTGNKLRDPITGKYVIILSRKILVNLINITYFYFFNFFITTIYNFYINIIYFYFYFFIRFWYFS